MMHAFRKLGASKEIKDGKEGILYRSGRVEEHNAAANSFLEGCKTRLKFLLFSYFNAG
jgi:hypothetical protein